MANRRLRPLMMGLAMLTGVVAPIFQLLTATGLAMRKRPENMAQQMMLLHMMTRRYMRTVLAPALLVLAAVTAWSLGSFRWLASRILGGVFAGVLSTIGLDAVRLWGYRRGYMPSDMPRQFGRMILGPQGKPRDVKFAGYAYHFLNGAGFGIFYTIVFGPARWLWGVVWGLIVWIAMMVSPPMLMSRSGPFLWRKGPGPALTALVAHLVMGVIIGVVSRTVLSDKDASFVEVLRGHRKG
jgi:hypothetical protein